MKKALFIISVLLVLCLCGCEAELATPVTGSETSSTIVASEPEPETVNQESSFSQPVDFQESARPQESMEETRPDEPESNPVAAEMSLPDHTTSAPQPTDHPSDETPTVTEAQGESQQPQQSTEVEPTDPPESSSSQPVTTETKSEPEIETEPETDPEPTEAPEFNIGYWISYAQSTATRKGLNLDSSAVDCWDNPISANANCIYLERDINSRLSRYAGDEEITDVWIWYEDLGGGEYLIYIGYA